MHHKSHRGNLSYKFKLPTSIVYYLSVQKVKSVKAVFKCLENVELE